MESPLGFYLPPVIVLATIPKCRSCSKRRSQCCSFQLRCVFFSHFAVEGIVSLINEVLKFHETPSLKLKILSFLLVLLTSTSYSSLLAFAPLIWSIPQQQQQAL
jgi:hypothetical protein